MYKDFPKLNLPILHGLFDQYLFSQSHTFIFQNIFEAYTKFDLNLFLKEMNEIEDQLIFKKIL